MMNAMKEVREHEQRTMKVVEELKEQLLEKNKIEFTNEK